MRRFYSDSLVLFFSFLIVYLWSLLPLAEYTPPLLGIFVLLYLATSIIGKKIIAKKHQERILGAISIFLLLTTILIVITYSGGLSSHFFFLLYFVCFGISLLLIPESIIIFIILTLGLFFPTAIKSGDIVSWVKLGSLLLICPLAYFFGKEFRARRKDEMQIAVITNKTEQAVEKIQEDVEKIIVNQASNLEKEDVEKLKEIIDETKALEGSIKQ